MTQDSLEIYERAREAAIGAARAGGALIAHWAGRVEADEVREKGAHDLVTRLDEEVQELLVDRLSSEFPSYSFLAEEGGLAVDHEPTATGFRWIIDPIDGTTNFARGAPPYAVSIGLEHEGQLVAGVIHDPSRDETFSAVRGGGVLLDGEPASVSRTRTLEQAVVATGFPYRAIGHLDAFLEVLRELITRCHGFRRLGSAAIDLAYVAVGRFDGFYEAGLSAWDMAAGRLLVEEGGGRITSLSGSPHSLYAGQIVASNGLVHDELLAVLAPLARSTGR